MSLREGLRILAAAAFVNFVPGCAPADAECELAEAGSRTLGTRACIPAEHADLDAMRGDCGEHPERVPRTVTVNGKEIAVEVWRCLRGAK